LQDNKAVVALVNIFSPLPFVEVGGELGTYDLVRLLTPAVADVVKPATLIDRYKKISSAAVEPVALPALPILIEKVVSPLVNAKAAFVAGNPLGTIALCGFVAEMMALMLHEMARNDGLMIDVTENEFESYGQQKRVKTLRDQEIISQEATSAFDVIRENRRAYLHFISKAHSFVFDDALESYTKSMWLLVDLVGQEFKDGALILKPSFARYLRTHGFL
jgi:hypothetical protein